MKKERGKKNPEENKYQKKAMQMLMGSPILARNALFRRTLNPSHPQIDAHTRCVTPGQPLKPERPYFKVPSPRFFDSRPSRSTYAVLVVVVMVGV
jgi:hypothetical protein